MRSASDACEASARSPRRALASRSTPSSRAGSAPDGAVATQAIAQVAHGPGALRRLADGLDPAGAIEAVLREDESADYRQLGAVDAAGRVSSHTGRSCIAHAGARSGEGFSSQANMMA